MSHANLNATPQDRQTLPGRYLTFRNNSESYGIRVLAVREIIRQAPITVVPQMPPYIRGVLNLRGRIIPVIDLKHRFGMGVAEVGNRTCIVVVQIDTIACGPIQMGLMVDIVEEVVQIAAADISPTPDFGVSIDTSFLLGIAKVKGEVKILLNLDHVLTGEQVDQLSSVADPVAPCPTV